MLNKNGQTTESKMDTLFSTVFATALLRSALFHATSDEDPPSSSLLLAVSCLSWWRPNASELQSNIIHPFHIKVNTRSNCQFSQTLCQFVLNYHAHARTQSSCRARVEGIFTLGQIYSTKKKEKEKKKVTQVERIWTRLSHPALGCRGEEGSAHTWLCVPHVSHSTSQAVWVVPNYKQALPDAMSLSSNACVLCGAESTDFLSIYT